MLAITVEDEKIKARSGEQLPEAGLDRGPFPGIHLVLHDPRPRGLGIRRSLVGRSIIHHHDEVELLAGTFHHFRDPGFFAEGRDQGRYVGPVNHRIAG
ncbi:MAG: hypothetical protein QM796_14665 [Chthoniobacteraceae bacterium]